MTTISMSEFRRDSEAVLVKVQQGETVVVTDDGKPAVRMAPLLSAMEDAMARSQGPTGFVDLAEQWDSSHPESQGSLTNEEIDRIVYGI